jgi:hypothetical protein
MIKINQNNNLFKFLIYLCKLNFIIILKLLFRSRKKYSIE